MFHLPLLQIGHRKCIKYIGVIFILHVVVRRGLSYYIEQKARCLFSRDEQGCNRRISNGIATKRASVFKVSVNLNNSSLKQYLWTYYNSIPLAYSVGSRV